MHKSFPNVINIHWLSYNICLTFINFATLIVNKSVYILFHVRWWLQWLLMVLINSGLTMHYHDYCIHSWPSQSMHHNWSTACTCTAAQVSWKWTQVTQLSTQTILHLTFRNSNNILFRLIPETTRPLSTCFCWTSTIFSFANIKISCLETKKIFRGH